MKRLVWPLVIAGIIAAMIGLFLIGNRDTGSSPEQADQTRIGTKHAEQPRTHIQLTDAHEPYNSNLPSSGPHYGVANPWGVSDKTIQDEILVHNLEHGGIWIAYKPDLPADQVNKLKQLAQTLPKSTRFNTVKVVIEPRSANTAPIQLAAWTYTLDLQQYDEAPSPSFTAVISIRGPSSFRRRNY